MSGWQKVLSFALVAVVAFAAATGVGRAVGPIERDEEIAHGHADDAAADGQGDGHADGDAGEHGGGDAAADAFTLEMDRSVHDAGRQRLVFTIRDDAGEPVTSYDVAHEKLLHLVLVRRDLGGYRHVHPDLDEATGEWSVPVNLDAGTWRIYADFTPTGAEAALAETEVFVAGDFQPATPATANDTALVDGYEVHLSREGDQLRLHVVRDGVEVTDLEPYLGAYGHLVAIRADDMSYLHVHPEEGPAGPTVAFHATLAADAPHRLFFEFQHDGEIHRAEFTVTSPGEGHDEGHDEGGDDDEHDH